MSQIRSLEIEIAEKTAKLAYVRACNECPGRVVENLTNYKTVGAARALAEMYLRHKRGA